MHSLGAGIWTKDLKNKTNLQQPQVTKILKNLDARGLVKSVKAVAHPTRKLYMLAELEPARELTGGSWCARMQLLSCHPACSSLLNTPIGDCMRALPGPFLPVSTAASTNGALLMYSKVLRWPSCGTSEGLCSRAALRVVLLGMQVYSPGV